MPKQNCVTSIRTMSKPKTLQERYTNAKVRWRKTVIKSYFCCYFIPRFVECLLCRSQKTDSRLAALQLKQTIQLHETDLITDHAHLTQGTWLREQSWSNSIQERNIATSPPPNPNVLLVENNEIWSVGEHSASVDPTTNEWTAIKS